ncbi:hydroxyproline-rich glycoprotein family protein [Actinidia rufa]|uniref:Hydroxyproline-rich glycoprotein family protein n=1 Tax=Actinidia rufa TaxID=165716 RepID=A0A7J0H2H3_9ERIC|nr:hydroxyproline-rich glycoprotein family protein [Actinidia rufa]
MKRGKDDEKSMGPMFPRLHVNDTEKGGPRAPPRNKMALYEQLSIPSQRFNHGMVPQNPNNTASGFPPASSSQESGHERGMFYQLHQHRSTQPAEKPFAGSSDYNNPLAVLEQEKRQDDEDFTVPTFVESETGKDHSKNSNGMNREVFPSSTPACLCHSMNTHNTSDKEPRRSSNTGFSFRQEGICQDEEHPKESMEVGEKSVTYVRGSPAKEKTKGPLKQTDTSAGQEHRHNLANNSDRLHSSGASLNHESRAGPQMQNSMCGNGVSNEPVMGKENGSYSVLRNDSCPEKLGSLNATNDCGHHEAKPHGSLQMGNGDRSDEASETSMVDISPDDVVGIIGQKHFWKARKAIVNQQRVFAVQVFELHRLIKVQRLIAGSPNVLIEDGAYLGKPLKVSSAKKVPLEYIVKPSPHIPEHKDDSENPNHKMTCSAENVVGKTSVSSTQNVSQPSNYGPFSGNSFSAPYFPQPPGHQWLIPIMSPSEGLIYKPYPGHGFVGPVYGGCGPPGSNPVMGGSINPAYGVPAPHHHYPGMGFPSAAPPVGHGYFPLYPPAISPINFGLAVEQANSFAGQGLHGQPGQLLGGGIHFMQQQSSCNLPTPNHSAIPNVVNLRGSNGGEIQDSTASSPRVVGPTSEGRNPLPLFPTSPAINVLEGASQVNDTDQPARVIKVVPRNARSVTESVARIFQSIQEERKQYDSVSLN